MVRLVLPTLFSVLLSLSYAAQLTDEVLHYEPLTYDSLDLANRHARYRRDVSSYHSAEGSGGNIRVNFFSFGRNISLVLTPSRSTFHHDAKLEIDGKETPLDTSHLFTGYVTGDPQSYVFGAITSGVFQGRILLGTGESFHIERSEHYRANPDLAADPGIHSVIYKDADVDHEKFFNRRKRSTKDSSTCANTNSETAEWMRRVQRSAVVENTQHYHSSHNAYLKRYPRQTRSATTCHLLMRSDPELWRYYEQEFFANQAVTNAQIHEEITTLFHNHVQEVHRIYRNYAFQNGNGERFLGYGFRVDRVQIMTLCGSVEEDALCSRNLDATYLLNIHSIQDHDEYCLAYLFTSRDFDEGTLGLAWVAEPTNTQGGICARHIRFTNDNGGQTKKSLNTGIVTLRNYGKKVNPSVSYITFAHEIGHNFGSSHDQTDQNPSCTPFTDYNSADGNYIMFASATMGDKSNNDKFSPCSSRSIASVLSAVTEERNGKLDCLQDAGGAVCGNRIYEDTVEEGKTTEQCDCGFQDDCLKGDEDCCLCCVGKTNAGDPNACQLRTDGGVSCDPSQGPCCTNRCQFVGTDRVCQPKGECVEALRCNGQSAQCPSASLNDYQQLNDQPCNNETQVCNQGGCNGTICSRIGGGGTWTDCESPRDEKDITRPCFVSCQLNNGTCYNSADVESDGFPQEFKAMLQLVRANKKSLSIPRVPGHICDMDTGFCDHFQKCRQINVQGPLSRLKDLLFSTSTLKMIQNWVTEYWWATALSVLGFLALMLLFVKVCAVHTPSSNPNAPKARRLSQTLTLRRRQARQAGQGAPSSQGNWEQARSQGPAAQPQQQARSRGPAAHPQQVPMSEYESFQARSSSSDQPPPYSSIITRENETSSSSRPSAHGSRPSRQHMEMKEKRKQRR